MKTRLFQIIKGLLLIVIMLTFVAVNSQTKNDVKPNVGKPGSIKTDTIKDGAKVKFSITNLVAVSDKVLEFDLYLKDIGSDKPFELSIIQMGILLNGDITNGGNVLSTVVQEFSELNPSQQPSTTLFVKEKDKTIIKVAGKVCPGPGNGTIIKSTGKGTKVCRLRLTNTVPFAKVKPNLTFSFDKFPYATKIYHYIGKISIQLPTNSGNCVTEISNPGIKK